MHVFSFVKLHRKYDSVYNENRRLKQYETELLASLNARDQKCKELEDKCNKIQEDVEGKTKEKIVSQQAKYREFKVELDKIIKTLNADADVSICNYCKVI